MRKEKKILGTLLAVVLLLSALGGSTFAAEKTNLCTTFDRTAGVFVSDYIGGDIDGTEATVYEKIPAGYCFAQYVHNMMAREDLLEDYIEYVDSGDEEIPPLYQCSIPYAVFEAKAKSIADYSGDFKSEDLGLYDSATDCMIFNQEEFSSSMGHPAYVIGYAENGNEYDIYIQRMQMGFETLEEMEAEFGEYYSDYDREKDVFVDDDGYYHLVHRNIFYKLTATYSSNQIYYKAVEKLTSVEGISMITRDTVLLDDTSINVKKDGCSVIAPNGVFLPNTNIIIEKLISGDLFTNAQKAMENLCEKMTVYEITAMHNNMKLQPNGAVTVTFDIPKDYDINKVAVFYVSPEGKTEKLDGDVNKADRMIKVKLTHFSTYVVAETKAATEKAPQTGDNSYMTYQTGVLLMSSAAVMLMLFDRKRKSVI